MADRPNILLILTDQHRLSAVGAYGPTPCLTPHIDRLASEGILFENTYTTCPVCTPARGSILTGEFPHTHGMKLNENCHGLAAQRLRKRDDLLSRRLGAAGYMCGYNGKWHLGDHETKVTDDVTLPSVLPSDVGFEGFDYGGHGDGGHGFADYKDYLAEHGWRHEAVHDVEIDMPSLPRWGRLTGPLESSVPYYITTNTLELIGKFRARGSPWFVWHNFWGPHEPHYATAEYVDRYRGVAIPEWPNFRMDEVPMDLPQAMNRHIRYEDMKWEYYEELIRHYYAFTTMIDDQIGRLVEDLRNRGELENTVVIFAADHGETLGSHAGLGDKGWHHFEEIERIPLIVRLPESLRGSIEPGLRVSSLVSLADVYSTITELAGQPPEPSGVRGRSLLALMRDPGVDWRDTVGCEFWGLNGLTCSMVSIRHGDHKYGWNAGAGDELYDLKSDPHELHNLATDGAHADVRLEMIERMALWMDETGMPPQVQRHFRLGVRR